MNKLPEYKKGRHRVTRQPEHRLPSDQAVYGRLSGLDGDAVQQHPAVAELFNDFLRGVLYPNGTASGNQQQVAFSAACFTVCFSVS
jgi:hypothetical protein